MGSKPEERVESGIPRLDHILKGGFLVGGLYVLTGPPGSGKTILGNQFCFNHIAAGGRAVFLTLLSESHGRMLGHLRSMAFFDAERVSNEIQYISGYRVLDQRGLDGLKDLIQKVIREQNASVLVIDGFDSVADRADDQREFKRLIYDLQVFTSLLSCTAILITTPRGDRIAHENTLADGVLELTHTLLGPRSVRELIVHKFRGSDMLPGRHEVEISERGIVIHPRTEVQFRAPPESAEEERIRMGFGVERLDAMCHGGLLSGSTSVVLGAPGTGKTLLGLQFLAEGAKQGQPGVYFGFFETPPRLLEKARAVGVDLEPAVKSGLIEIQWQPPLEHNLDSLAERLLERIKERNVRRMRLFVDGIAGFRSSVVYPERVGRFFSALTHQLRSEDVTTLFTEETGLFPEKIDMPTEELAGVFENILFLRYVELHSQIYRLISILKMRESDYDPAIREFSIGRKGIRVAESFESAEEILTGHARIRTALPRDDEGMP